MGSTLLPRPDENVFQRRFLVTHNQTPTLDRIEIFSLVILSDATLSHCVPLRALLKPQYIPEFQINIKPTMDI
jgi:hypothetical protein